MSLPDKCHSDCRAVVKHLIDLAADLVSGSAIAIAPRVAVLNHKVWHDAVNGDVSIIISLGKLNEVVYRQWGCVGEKLNSKRTLAGSHDGSHISADPASARL